MTTTSDRLATALRNLLSDMDAERDTGDSVSEAMGALAEYDAAHQAQDGDAKDATLKWALDAGGVLADWCNKSGDALHAMMAAYERRVRSLCTPEEIGKEPWRCAEFIVAESVLREKPTWGYVISQASAPPPPQQEAQS